MADTDWTELSRKCEQNMISKINQFPELKNWLISFKPDKNKGFMYTEHENIQKISKLVEDDGHSGASFACCLRSVQAQLQSD